MVLSQEENKFYSDTKHGWFWYEDPLAVLEEKPEDPVTLVEQKAAQATRKEPSLDNYSVEELWNMHPDDFQSLLNGLQKKAVQA
ncbi:MAG: conjugal transfer protein TraF, partial [Desulfobulbaceae bacterium]